MTTASEIIEWVRGHATNRKQRLFALAALREFWKGAILLVASPSWLIKIGERVPSALESAEAFADGECTRRDFTRSWNGVTGGPYNIFRSIGRSRAADTLRVFSAYKSCLAELGAPDDAYEQTVRDCFAEIFGAQFQPTQFDTRWRTADAVALARGIYDDRAFQRLPILADALMDAGCVDDAILSHCQSGRQHFRGCWVVDLVLGRV